MSVKFKPRKGFGVNYRQFYAGEIHALADLLDQWRSSLALYRQIPEWDNTAQAEQSNVLTGIYGRYIDLCEAEDIEPGSKSPFALPVHNPIEDE